MGSGLLILFGAHGHVDVSNYANLLLGAKLCRARIERYGARVALLYVDSSAAASLAKGHNSSY